MSTEQADAAEIRHRMEDVDPHGDAMATTIFQKLGSWTALKLAVDLFYDKVLSDPLLAPYFEHVPMERLRRKQMMFMSFAFGGTDEFYGKQVAYAHRQMVLEQGLTLTHYDAVAGHFKATLTELGVAPDIITQATGVVLSTRSMFDPEAVFAQAQAIHEKTHAPLAQSLRALQAELTGTCPFSRASTSTTATGCSSAGPADPTTQTTHSGASTNLLGPLAAANASQGSGIRVSALAQIFAPQVLDKDKIEQFQALARQRRSSSGSGATGTGAGAAPISGSSGTATQQPAQTSPSAADQQEQGNHHRHPALVQVGAVPEPCSGGSQQGHGGGGPCRSPRCQQRPAEGPQDSRQVLETGKASAAAGSKAATDGQLDAAALEAKRQRKALMKEILRGIGVLPGAPSTTTTPLTSQPLSNVSSELGPSAAAHPATAAPVPAPQEHVPPVSPARTSSNTFLDSARTTPLPPSPLTVQTYPADHPALDLSALHLRDPPQDDAEAETAQVARATRTSATLVGDWLRQLPSSGLVVSDSNNVLAPGSPCQATTPRDPVSRGVSLADLPELPEQLTGRSRGGRGGARHSSGCCSSSSSSGQSFMDSDEDISGLYGVHKVRNPPKKVPSMGSNRRVPRVVRNTSRLSQSSTDGRTSVGAVSRTSSASKLTPRATNNSLAGPSFASDGFGTGAGSFVFDSSATAGSTSAGLLKTGGSQDFWVSGTSFDRPSSPLATLEEVSEPANSHENSGTGRISQEIVRGLFTQHSAEPVN